MNVDLNMSVLIIDDHLEMRQIVCNLLKQLGFRNVDQSPGVNIAMEMLHLSLIHISEPTRPY